MHRPMTTASATDHRNTLTRTALQRAALETAPSRPSRTSSTAPQLAADGLPVHTRDGRVLDVVLVGLVVFVILAMAYAGVS